MKRFIHSTFKVFPHNKRKTYLIPPKWIFEDLLSLMQRKLKCFCRTRAIFQEYSYLDIEDTYASDYNKIRLFSFRNNHQNYAKMAYNLTSNMLLYYTSWNIHGIHSFFLRVFIYI